ncbi:unnamed protein product [Rotaria sp. Silwood1]|nr:unnamed protein product [Rotaria sp. Silwood1]CAF1603691.1 unnamed protein product [Rotaria sp. Silwood1]CAF3722959.1 unnamed protein product [Rotaria sp. Silwood1]CAF3771248.1 unnamed protein product [Rotaria sp. Silwood1]CAF3794964.1 unnamed protein product [Rotaria sp. Silwood1]
MNNRKSPSKQQRTKNSHLQSVSNSNYIRSNNSNINLSYIKNSNSQYRHYSHTNSPIAISASSSPAVPLFYSQIYADPPECSLLPKPPESWYLNTNNNENLSIDIKKKQNEIPKEKFQQKSYHKNNNNRGFYSPFYITKTYEKFPAQYISVKG